MQKTVETVNIRIYKHTHELLKKLANNRRQDLIVALDELVKNFAGPFEEKD